MNDDDDCVACAEIYHGRYVRFNREDVTLDGDFTRAELLHLASHLPERVPL